MKRLLSHWVIEIASHWSLFSGEQNRKETKQTLIHRRSISSLIFLPFTLMTIFYIGNKSILIHNSKHWPNFQARNNRCFWSLSLPTSATACKLQSGPISLVGIYKLSVFDLIPDGLLCRRGPSVSASSHYRLYFHKSLALPLPQVCTVLTRTSSKYAALTTNAQSFFLHISCGDFLTKLPWASIIIIILLLWSHFFLQYLVLIWYLVFSVHFNKSI